MNQQPNAFEGLRINRRVREIRDFNEEHPLPFRNTDDGAGAEGWTFFEFLSGWKKNNYDEKLWWKLYNGEIISFDSEGRKMFLGIAHIVISFHEKKRFSGNLVRRIRILHDLNVTHESPPQEDEQAFENGGQKSDIDHFRWMVAAVVRTAFPKHYRHMTSSQFRLFFSEIFTVQEGLKYYFVSQLYHPIFFNSSDRCNLIRTMRDLYNLNRYEFKNHFELRSYGFQFWWDRLYRQKRIRYARDYQRVLNYGSNFNSLYYERNGFALPLYIRNVHEHFQQGGVYHKDIDLEIDNLFPGVSAAIYDSIIRNLHGYWSLFGPTITLPYLQRTAPFGWCFPPYRFLN